MQDLHETYKQHNKLTTTFFKKTNVTCFTDDRPCQVKDKKLICWLLHVTLGLCLFFMFLLRIIIAISLHYHCIIIALLLQYHCIVIELSSIIADFVLHHH